MKSVIFFFAAAWLGVIFYQQAKPLPDGLSVVGALRPSSEVRFVYDLTFERDGGKVSEQMIFEEICRLVDGAQHFVLLDFFLFNGLHDPRQPFPPLAEALTSRIITKRQRAPQVDIVLITDEINRQYGSHEFEHLQRLRQAGVRVIYTDLSRLRDSNFFYSAWWRLCCQWLGSEGAGWLFSPFATGGPRLSLRGYLNLMNFKANHRKVAMNEGEALIASANPHDASALHSNIGVLVRGEVLRDIVVAETAVAAMSGQTIPSFAPLSAPAGENPVQVQLLTEGGIKRRILEAINGCGPGDRVDLAMFYLSDRQVINALLAAAGRGAVVRLVLDPNREAFGRAKNGIPNRPVAAELTKRSNGAIRVRWYRTRGEQFHSKLILVAAKERLLLVGGSANLTGRNLNDLNVEADLAVLASMDAPVASQAMEYFQRIWENRGGVYTDDFGVWQDASSTRYWLYRFQEWSGMSTF